MLLSLVIPFSVKLRTENTGSWNAAENTDIKNKHKLIDNGHTGHLLRANLPYHDVIQKAYKAGDGVLDNHGNRKIKHIPVKFSVANKFFLKLSPHDKFSSKSACQTILIETSYAVNT